MGMNTDIETLGITKEEYLRAVQDGVAQAIWQVATNATTMPCADFYAHIKDGVSEAVSNMDLNLGDGN